MIFTDAVFFVFFPLAFSVYWWLGDNQSRKAWLLACSIIFYSAWDWRFLGLVLIEIVNAYTVTRLLDERAERWRRPIIVVCIAAITTLGSNANSTFSFVASAVKPPSTTTTSS